MSNGNYIPGKDAFDKWKGEILSGSKPTIYPMGKGDLEKIEFGPGSVLLLGGQPGAGKTAFSMQAVVDALRLTPDLRAVVCNVEMSTNALLDRQLARLSGIDLSLIRHRQLTADHADRIDQALQTLEPLTRRLAFLESPYNLDNVAAAADDIEAQILLLDYIQRIPPPGEHGDRRGSVNASMDFIRKFTDEGRAVIVISAVGRSKDSKGRASYAGEGLSLASFRESSELEFGADDAFILTTNDDQGEEVTLRHLKSRHGDCQDIELTFDRKRQRFTSSTSSATGDKGSKADSTKAKSALAALWAKTPPAGEGGNK